MRTEDAHHFHLLRNVANTKSFEWREELGE